MSNFNLVGRSEVVLATHRFPSPKAGSHSLTRWLEIAHYQER